MSTTFRAHAPTPAGHVDPCDSYVIESTSAMRRFSALWRAVVGGPGIAAGQLDGQPVGAEEKQLFYEILGRDPQDERYEIRRKTAEGGMGVLYLAEDRDFQRDTVIKVVVPTLHTDESVLRTFVREARITAQLEHPNIVPVHDVGFLPDHGIFFTMKLVRGESLSQILKKIEAANTEYRQRYDAFTLLNVFRKVCDAVAFAHSRQVIHRDIKPGNVMVGDFGEVLLMDWGLAKHFNAPGLPTMEDDGGTSGFGVLKGSPGYMSPEQAWGDNDSLDPRSDVFLLGAALYHIFTFYPPYVETQIEVLLRRARQCDYRPPAACETGGLPVPEDVCAVIDRAMAPDPADRYQTVEDLAADVDAILHGRLRLDQHIFEAGEMLMCEGEPGNDIYMIMSGEVEVYKQRGDRRIVLGRLAAGDVVGEMSLLTKQPRSASVVAVDRVVTMAMDEGRFLQHLKLLPPWLERTVVALAERLEETDRRLADGE